MMFDVMKLRAQLFFRNTKHARQFILQVTHFRGIAESILDLMTGKSRNACGGKQDLLVQVRRGIARDTNVVQFFKPNSRRFETVTNRLLWKARRVLEAIEALFFRGGDQLAIFEIAAAASP